MTDTEIIEALAERYNWLLQMPEPECWDFGAWSLYGPKHPENQSGKWELWHAVVTPGVWRTKNGDGWPDTVDVDCDSDYPTIWPALIALGGKLVAEEIDAMSESAMMEPPCSEEEAP